MTDKRKPEDGEYDAPDEETTKDLSDDLSSDDGTSGDATNDHDESTVDEDSTVSDDGEAHDGNDEEVENASEGEGAADSSPEETEEHFSASEEFPGLVSDDTSTLEWAPHDPAEDKGRKTRVFPYVLLAILVIAVGSLFYAYSTGVFEENPEEDPNLISVPSAAGYVPENEPGSEDDEEDGESSDSESPSEESSETEDSDSGNTEDDGDDASGEESGQGSDEAGVETPSASPDDSDEEGTRNGCERYESIGLECSITYEVDNEIPRGNLVSQSPEAGEFVELGTTVELVYSSGPESTEFPEVHNESLEHVEEMLWEGGVSVDEVEYVSGSGIPEDRVVSASVESGEDVDNGDTVVVQLSDGTVKIPDWTDETQAKVESKAEELGIDVVFNTEESEKSEGTVLSQSDSGEVHFNDIIEVTVAVPFESVELEVPDVLGMSEEDAQYALAEEGFRNISTLEVTTGEVDEPTVTQVSPGVGSTGMSEERIVIVISTPEDSGGDE